MTLPTQTTEPIEPSRNKPKANCAFGSVEIDAVRPADVTRVVRQRPATDAGQLLAPFAAVAVSMLFCACTSSLGLPNGGLSSDANAVLVSCSSDASVHVRAAVDMSATRSLEPLSSAERASLRSQIQRAAICGGTVEVAAFFGSVASTRSLFSGELHLEGATDNARLRREPDLTDSVMEAVDAGLTDLQVSPAEPTRQAGGTDVVGQLVQSAEFAQQIDPTDTGSNLSVLLITDGEDNLQLAFDDPDLTPTSALSIADAATVPDLSGAQLTIIGIGKSSSGTPAATAYVDTLKAGWNRICERTNAAECTVVTDPANGR